LGRFGQAFEVKPKPYTIFLIVAMPLSIALIILDLRFSGDERFGGISNVSQAVLFLLGLIGAIAGWWRYGIQGHSAFEDLRRWLNRTSWPRQGSTRPREEK